MSNIKSTSYDGAKMELTIEFSDGGQYRYFGVDMDEFEAFQSADSKGSFFAKHLRPFKTWQKLD
jgi:hypothetical protein